MKPWNLDIVFKGIGKNLKEMHIGCLLWLGSIKIVKRVNVSTCNIVYSNVYNLQQEGIFKDGVVLDSCRCIQTGLSF